MHSQLCMRRNLPKRPPESFINDCLDLFDELLGPGLPGGVLPLNHLQRVVRCVELCPQALNRPDLHFEGAGNGSVVITWIGREHELYSGTSPISLVEHCVTFRHDRRLLSLLWFEYNWPTSRWSATKKENWFSLNGNGIISSFLGRQFYRSTLYKFSEGHTFEKARLIGLELCRKQGLIRNLSR